MLKLVTLSVALVLWVVPAGEVSALGGAPSAAAGGPSQRALEARREVLFQRMLEAPGDLDASFDYALLSIRLDDLEGAVSTLERMLIFAPGLSRVQVELGILYYRLGSHATARAYLEAAARASDLPPDMRDRVQIYLREIELQIDPPPKSGTIYSGIRWQSNANTGPSSRFITLNGLPFILDEEATGQSDWSVVTIGTARLVHDPKRQGDLFEANLLAYSARYFEQSQVNLEYFEATAGPSLNMRRFGIDKTRAFIYAVADLARLEDNRYFASGGGGIRIVSHLAERATIRLDGTVRERRYNDTRQRPTASLRDGTLTKVESHYSYRLGPRTVLSVHGHTLREKLDADFFSNREFGVGAGIAKTFPSLLPGHKKFAKPWLLHLSGGFIERRYDEPDPTINPTLRQRDQIAWGRAALVVPVWERWALIPQIEYRDHSSNYDIRSFDNLTVMVGGQWRY